MKIFVGFFLLFVIVSESYGEGRGIVLNSKNRMDREPDRMALIIGNSRYPFSPLKNPKNDAMAMADVLKALDFQVYSYYDLTLKEMKKAVDGFGRRLRPGTVALFYYAGHGMQLNNMNYLIPIDATARVQEDIEYESMNAGRLIGKMQAAKNRINIIILDACRDNPFSTSFRSVSRGLAKMNAPLGTFIAYSTSPGSVAFDGNESNSVFTQALLDNIVQPNRKIEETFKQVRIAVYEKTKGKQVPWDSSSLLSDFYFTKDTITKVATVKSQGETKTRKQIFEKQYVQPIPDKKTLTEVGAVRLMIEDLKALLIESNGNVPLKVGTIIYAEDEDNRLSPLKIRKIEDNLISASPLTGHYKHHPGQKVYGKLN